MKLTPLEKFDAETVARMWQLHPVERLSALTMTVVQCNPRDTRAAIRGMLAIVKAMSVIHDARNRGGFASDIREDAADEIERPMLVH